MSVQKFCGLLAGAKLNEADRKWFPRWIRSYASSLKISKGELRVTEADVIDFSKSLRDTKTPAWLRLQAVRAFLTHLAVEGNVAPRTQTQAKSALLFLFQEVLGRELGFLNVKQATKASRLPVVLSRREIERLFLEFQGLRRLMFLVMYGAGLRHRECRRLRVKDVCFDEGHIVVRSGKGDQDRITVLPKRAREPGGRTDRTGPPPAST